LASPKQHNNNSINDVIYILYIVAFLFQRLVFAAPCYA